MLFGKRLLAFALLTALNLKADPPAYLEPVITFESGPSQSLTVSFDDKPLLRNTNLSRQLATKKAEKIFVAEKDNQDPAIKKALIEVWANDRANLDVRRSAWQAANQVDIQNRNRFASLVQKEYEKILASKGNLIDFTTSIELIPKNYRKTWGDLPRGVIPLPILGGRIKGLTLKNNLLNGYPSVQLIKTDVQKVDEESAIAHLQYNIASKADPTLDSTLKELPIQGYILEGRKLENDLVLFSFPDNLSCGVYLVRVQNDVYRVFVSPQAETDQVVLLPETTRPFLSSLKRKGEEIPTTNFIAGDYMAYKDEIGKNIEALPDCVGFIDYTFNKSGQILDISFRNPANDGPPTIQFATERDAVESCKRTMLSATVVGPYSDFTHGTTFRRISLPKTMVTEQNYIINYLKNASNRVSVLYDTPPDVIGEATVLVGDFHSQREPSFSPSGKRYTYEIKLTIHANGKCTSVELAGGPFGRGDDKKIESMLLSGFRGKFKPATYKGRPITASVSGSLTIALGKVRTVAFDYTTSEAQAFLFTLNLKPGSQ